eukprot:7855441-Alexandrium_andersonii.AAC.1
MHTSSLAKLSAVSCFALSGGATAPLAPGPPEERLRRRVPEAFFGGARWARESRKLLKAAFDARLPLCT